MDEIESLQKEVAELRSKVTLLGDIPKQLHLSHLSREKHPIYEFDRQGVKTIIAIGHSGYSRDIEIAKAVPDLDVVVGAHSHSFLYSPTK